MAGTKIEQASHSHWNLRLWSYFKASVDHDVIAMTVIGVDYGFVPVRRKTGY